MVSLTVMKHVARKQKTMRYNEDLLDAVTLLSFMIGIANYGQNLSQNDKDDMMQALDRKTNAMIERLENDLEEQNKLLNEILNILKEGS